MDNPDATLPERLRLLIGDQPITAFARSCGLSESMVRKYLGGAEPGVSKLVRIARATGVRLEWLATGQGPRTEAEAEDELDAAAEEAAEGRRLPPGTLVFDEQALYEAVLAIEHWLAGRRQKVPAEKRAELVAAVYRLVLRRQAQAAGRGDHRTRRAIEADLAEVGEIIDAILK